MKKIRIAKTNTAHEPKLRMKLQRWSRKSWDKQEFDRKSLDDLSALKRAIGLKNKKRKTTMARKAAKKAPKKEIEAVEAEIVEETSDEKPAKGGKRGKKSESLELEGVEALDFAETPAKRAKKTDSGDAHVYKYLDLVGASTDGIEQAIQVALDRASKTVRHIDWVEVKESRGKVTDGRVDKFQVHFRAGFKLE